MVTSHTHAAVDQALYEAVKTEDDKCGPLATHSVVSNGQVLRIGVTADPKIPDTVRYDKVLEKKGEEIQNNILETEAQIKPLFRIILKSPPFIGPSNIPGNNKKSRGETMLSQYR